MIELNNNPFSTLVAPSSGMSTQESWRWATVKQVDPIKIMLDGEQTPLAISPDTLVPVATGDRVYTHIYNHRCVIMGVAAGSQVPAFSTTVDMLIDTGSDWRVDPNPSGVYPLRVDPHASDSIWKYTPDSGTKYHVVIPYDGYWHITGGIGMEIYDPARIPSGDANVTVGKRTSSGEYTPIIPGVLFQHVVEFTFAALPISGSIVPLRKADELAIIGDQGVRAYADSAVRLTYLGGLS